MMLKHQSVVLIILFVQVLYSGAAFSENRNNPCATPLTDKEVVSVFRQNAMKQLALEFGDAGLFVYDIEYSPVDDVLIRVESFAKYPRPGQKDLATMRIEGWVSRCQGTTIVRGNTWLADGTLSVKRYAAEELPGKGLRWGNPDAPLRFIVFLDSRCPHCHRLIDYAKPLVDAGKVFLELRQVAYLESENEAIKDTRLSETALALNVESKITDQEYLVMLSGFANETNVSDAGEGYRNALQLIQTNTATAKKILHIITVPGVLIQEKEHHNHYRQMGYWEINRIFQ